MSAALFLVSVFTADDLRVFQLMARQSGRSSGVLPVFLCIHTDPAALNSGGRGFLQESHDILPFKSERKCSDHREGENRMKQIFSAKIKSLQGGARLNIWLIGWFAFDTETRGSKAQNLLLNTFLFFSLFFNY